MTDLSLEELMDLAHQQLDLVESGRLPLAALETSACGRTAAICLKGLVIDLPADCGSRNLARPARRSACLS